jgi:DNA polymerase
VADLDLVRPTGVILLGATAGASVCGSSFRVGESHGRPLDRPASTFRANRRREWALSTIHPSAVLRSRSRAEDYAGLVDDPRAAASLLLGTWHLHPDRR